MSTDLLRNEPKGDLEMSDKLIKASPETWQKLRTAAFNRETFIKTVVEDLVNGKIKASEL